MNKNIKERIVDLLDGFGVASASDSVDTEHLLEMAKKSLCLINDIWDDTNVPYRQRAENKVEMIKTLKSQEASILSLTLSISMVIHELNSKLESDPTDEELLMKKGQAQRDLDDTMKLLDALFKLSLEVIKL